MEDLTPESLQAVTLFNPPISKHSSFAYHIQLGTLFIGTGKNTEPIPSSVIAYLHKFGISVESMNTVWIDCLFHEQSSAAANFNFLRDDKERVAAALIPEQPSPKQYES